MPLFQIKASNVRKIIYEKPYSFRIHSKIAVQSIDLKLLRKMARVVGNVINLSNKLKLSSLIAGTLPQGLIALT